MSSLIECNDFKEAMAKSHVKHGFDPNVFRKMLLRWYDENGRDLPWRVKGGRHADPYKVWLSEIMLQQTTVKAVIPYYNKFLMLWPTVNDLAAASEDEVLTEWAGLGYYSRARNLLKTAQLIVKDFGGDFPSDKKELLKLKGIGDYTASAISAISFSNPDVVIDGNVERVVSRLTCFTTAPKANKKDFAEVCRILSPVSSSERPGDYAQALMDLSSAICTPKRPKCDVCPIRSLCGAHQLSEQTKYPIKVPKAAKKKKYTGALVIFSDDKGALMLERRPEEGLLANTIGVPMTEWFDSYEDLVQSLQLYQLGVSENCKPYRHIFTHIDLDVSFVFSSRPIVEDGREMFYVPVSEIIPSEYPTLFKRILDRVLGS